MTVTSRYKSAQRVVLGDEPMPKILVGPRGPRGRLVSPRGLLMAFPVTESNTQEVYFFGAPPHKSAKNPAPIAILQLIPYLPIDITASGGLEHTLPTPRRWDRFYPTELDTQIQGGRTEVRPSI